MFVLNRLVNYILEKTSPKVHKFNIGKRHNTLVYDANLNGISIGMAKYITENNGTIKMRCGLYMYELSRNDYLNDSYRIEINCYLRLIKYITIIDIYNYDQFSSRTIDIFTRSNVIPIPKIVYK